MLSHSVQAVSFLLSSKVQQHHIQLLYIVLQLMLTCKQESAVSAYESFSIEAALVLSEGELELWGMNTCALHPPFQECSPRLAAEEQGHDQGR